MYATKVKLKTREVNGKTKDSMVQIKGICKKHRLPAAFALFMSGFL